MRVEDGVDDVLGERDALDVDVCDEVGDVEFVCDVVTDSVGVCDSVKLLEAFCSEEARTEIRVDFLAFFYFLGRVRSQLLQLLSPRLACDGVHSCEGVDIVLADIDCVCVGEVVGAALRVSVSVAVIDPLDVDVAACESLCDMDGEGDTLREVVAVGVCEPVQVLDGVDEVVIEGVQLAD